jgi:hypothetical protein
LACPENSDATAADTSSPAAANTPVVGTAATAFAALTAEPILDRSVAAEAKNSGATARYDIAILRQVTDTSANRMNLISV